MAPYTMTQLLSHLLLCGCIEHWLGNNASVLWLTTVFQIVGKNYCCSFNMEAEGRERMVVFSSVPGSDTRPLVVTHGEIRKLCWWLIRSWDSVEANQSTSHWISQTSELETVGSPSLSEEKQEKLPPVEWPLCKSTLQPFPIERK